MTGFVYCIGERGGLVKIGYSTDPRARLIKLRADSPVDAVLLGAIPGTPEDEAKWHKAFGVFHERGEWFNDEDEMISDRFPPMPAPVVEVVDLRSWLKANGISAAQLAAHIGVSPIRLSNMMTGRHRPNAETMWAIECATDGEITMQHWVRDVHQVASVRAQVPA
jgi:DNA-binding transcriptional regulator YdaS (Cro superfamily)